MDIVKYVLVATISFILFFIFFSDSEINYDKEVLDIISCQHYSYDYLVFYGYDDRFHGLTIEEKIKGCESLNLALYNQALDDCSEMVSKVLDFDEKQYNRLREHCVYHEMSVIRIMNSASLSEFRNITGKSPYKY